MFAACVCVCVHARMCVSVQNGSSHRMFRPSRCRLSNSVKEKVDKANITGMELVV